MELLVHINKRLKSRIKVQLPVDDLLKQFNDPESSSIVTVSLSQEVTLGPTSNIIFHLKKNNFGQRVN